MGQVRIREYNDAARSKVGLTTILLQGPLVTDFLGLSIKTLELTFGSAADAPALTGKTHFVALEAVDVNVRYAVRPQNRRWTQLAATENHAPIPAGGVVIEAVYPGAIISFLQTSLDGAVGQGVGWSATYVPVLAL